MGPELLCPVASNGEFTAEALDYQGRWVKDCDRDISRNLRHRGLLWHQEQYLHDYPFCWRADEDPLIQYPRQSWFIKTSRFKELMLINNALINWLPEHIKDGRFGNFLATNVDWALSRERYWGTPLPIWVCDKTGRQEAVANYDELLEKPGVHGTEVWDEAKRKNTELAEDLKIHKPYIDAVTYDSPFARSADAAHNRGDRLLVRLRRDAVCRSGAIRSRTRSDSRKTFRPTSSARLSIKPAAGSTASWRSARCFLGRDCRTR